MVKSVFDISNSQEFNEVANRIFSHQKSNNPVYAEFSQRLEATGNFGDLPFPFLPIEFFKSAEIKSFTVKPEETFTSSGTSGEGTSRHFVKSLSHYEKSFKIGFHRFYGTPSDYTILALLPSYLERDGSSLIYMVDKLIEQSEKPDSGFYLNNLDALAEKLKALDAAGERVLLIGVSFALLDLIEKHRFKLNNTIIMETGGMKGRRKEVTREELHRQLTIGFGVDSIHSEYGMTELLSQAYSKGNGRFKCPPWMKVLIREVNDPFKQASTGKTGGINVIDLANEDSCAFIATQDLGRLHEDGSFEVLGRFDQADVRGCNLMVS
ncbi:LuxE/PaaK family acyltransferase [Halocola ammonii]